MDCAGSVVSRCSLISPPVKYGDEHHDDANIKPIRPIHARARCRLCNLGVYLFNARTNVKPLILPHGLSTILEVSFSPDSKRLASMAGGQIKIWDVPRHPVPVQTLVPSAASSQPGEERDRTGDR